MSTRARRTWALDQLYRYFKANTIKIPKKPGRQPGPFGPYKTRRRFTEQPIVTPTPGTRRKRGRGSYWAVWPTEPYIGSVQPAPAGTVFGWAEHLVRSLVALQLEQQCYGEHRWRLDIVERCELCGWRERKHRFNRYSRTLGGWRVCRRCSGRVSVVNRQDPYGAYLLLQAREDDLSWQLDSPMTHDQAPRAHADDD